MARSADYEYKVIGKSQILEIQAGAADTLYKGSIASIGTDGYAKVGANVAAEVPIGVFVEQHVADGTAHEKVKIDTGMIWIPKVTQHVSTVLCTDDSGNNNANYNSKYFLVYNGTTAYYVWFDVNSGGTDPEVSGATGIEVDIGTTDDDSAVATALTAAIDAEDDFGATASTATVTITAALKGYSQITANGDLSTIVTITNTVYSAAIQGDIGEIFYCIADDGVVYTAAKGNSTIPVGLCLGFNFTNNLLLIDTLKKTLS